MSWVDELSDEVETLFQTTFDERDGRVVPESDDVALSDEAVKIEAAFLYADLAGSGAIAATCPWSTTAKIIRAYLSCAARLMRAYDGKIRSFDGDRVMAVFLGDLAASHATDCARRIHWTTENIVQAQAHRQFASVRNNDVKIRQACGVDIGLVRAVRAGIRNNNDLIWIGRAPSLAAKLSDLREYPYCSFITKAVHNSLRDSARKPDGKIIWDQKNVTYAGRSETIYRSKVMKQP